MPLSLSPFDCVQARHIYALSCLAKYSLNALLRCRDTSLRVSALVYLHLPSMYLICIAMLSLADFSFFDDGYIICNRGDCCIAERDGYHSFGRAQCSVHYSNDPTFISVVMIVFFASLPAALILYLCVFVHESIFLDESDLAKKRESSWREAFIPKVTATVPGGKSQTLTCLRPRIHTIARAIFESKTVTVITMAPVVMDRGVLPWP